MMTMLMSSMLETEQYLNFKMFLVRPTYSFAQLNLNRHIMFSPLTVLFYSYSCVRTKAKIEPLEHGIS